MVSESHFDHQRGVHLDELQMADPTQAERVDGGGVAMTFADHLRTHQDETKSLEKGK